MSVSSNDVDGTVGLTTPMLNDGERSGQTLEPHEKQPEPTVFDLALDIDTKSKQFLQTMSLNEDAINQRLDRIGERIAAVRKRTS